jgi:hypothetical protein
MACTPHRHPGTAAKDFHFDGARDRICALAWSRHSLFSASCTTAIAVLTGFPGPRSRVAFRSCSSIKARSDRKGRWCGRVG